MKIRHIHTHAHTQCLEMSWKTFQVPKQTVCVSVCVCVCVCVCLFGRGSWWTLLNNFQVSELYALSPDKRRWVWASLVAQWLRIHLPMQGTLVRALVQEDPTCRGATKPMRCNYWGCALEPASHSYWAHSPQLLKPAGLEPVLWSKRSHCNEKPTDTTRESLRAAMKTQHSQK